jgi:hypothetical protein
MDEFVLAMRRLRRLLAVAAATAISATAPATSRHVLLELVAHSFVVGSATPINIIDAADSRLARQLPLFAALSCHVCVRLSRLHHRAGGSAPGK